MDYASFRAERIARAQDAERFDRVVMDPLDIKRLNWKTNQLEKYPRQQRRNRDREEAREPAFSHRLIFALEQAEAGMGLFITTRRRDGLKIKRYRAAYLSERQDPVANYEGRYKALFPVPTGAEVL
jgi:hypothetical protein